MINFRTVKTGIPALILFIATSGVGNIWASPLSVTNTWSSGDTLNATDLNQNFTDVKTSVDDNDTRINGKQDRVTGSCPAGSAIRSIQADGSVSCQATTITNMSLRLFLQDGLNGYTGTTDTSLYKVPIGFNSTPGTFAQLYAEAQVDAATGMLTLIRFDMSMVTTMAQSYTQQFDSAFTLASCNAQVTVNNAQLQIFSIPGGGTSGNTPAYLLHYFEPSAPIFDELQADWTNANAGQLWDKNGVSIESFNDLVGGVTNAKDMPTSSYGRRDAFILETSIVKDWICDAATNTGMAIAVEGGGTGGSMHFFSREYVTPDWRPMLVLDLSISN